MNTKPVEKPTCESCDKQKKLIATLIEYVVDDMCDTYIYLKENYGPTHPETLAYSELLNRLHFVLAEKERARQGSKEGQS